MKTGINLRYVVLFALFAMAVIGIIAEPNATNTWAFIITLIASKVVGFAAAAIFCCLLTHWLRQGKLPRLNDMMKGGE